jgi:uncharacterized protein (DUF2384 family)
LWHVGRTGGRGGGIGRARGRKSLLVRVRWFIWGARRDILVSGALNLKPICYAFASCRVTTHHVARERKTKGYGAVARTIERIEATGGFKGTEIANITNVSKATVSRWRAGTIKPQPRNELILSDLDYIVDRLSEFYEADEIRQWLYAMHPQLEGQRAIDLIHQGRSLDVLKIIDRLDADVYL